VIREIVQPRWRQLVLIVTLVTVSGVAWGASGSASVTLTSHGQELQTQYERAMNTLRAELRKSVPTVDPQKKAAYMKARRAKTVAKVELASARSGFGAIQKAQGSVHHAKDKWIGGAEAGIARAQAMLKNATSDAERDAAHKELVKWQENRNAGLAALRERQAAFDKAKLREPELIKQREKAEIQLALTTDILKTASANLEAGALLSSDTLDGKLAKFAILSRATSNGLAAFAQQGQEQEKLVERLLGDTELMLKMLTAGGAKEGKFGEAIKIYADIQKASGRAAEPGILQNLALGISLEMVVPYNQRYSTFFSKGTNPVDPVERYLHYEKAYLAGELDPAFEDMSVWECRWIASDPSSNEDLAWLRTMMRNYRPDLLANADPRWFYTRIIKTDVAYRRHPWDNTLPISNMQQAIDRGGICHIRMWIARSTARAFGIPALRVETGGAKTPVTK
jgi:hypothetical protein